MKLIRIRMYNLPENTKSGELPAPVNQNPILRDDSKLTRLKICDSFISEKAETSLIT